MSEPEVSVVVCTYNRWEMLRRTLASCLADASPAGRAFEVIVSDNSPDGHAHALVSELSAGGAPVRWVPSGPGNISMARNAGLEAARAPLVAYLDDDLVVDRGWLDALVATVDSSGADVVLGPVRPDFGEAGPPWWDPDGTRYTRVVARPSGTRIWVAGPDRTPDFAFSTASSLFRRARVVDLAGEAPFAPELGVSGGEDVDLMWRLEKRGATAVWCAEAGVTETIPAPRTALRYQMLRAFAGGQGWIFFNRRHAGWLQVADLMGRGLLQVLGGAPLALFLFVTGRRVKAVHTALMVAAACGKLTWWRMAPLYRMEKPPEASS